MGSFTPNLSNYGETKHIWNMHSALSFNSMNQRAKLELALLTFVYMWDLFPSVCTFQNYLDLSFCLYHLHVVKQWQQIIHSRVRTQVVAVGTNIESFIVLKSSLVGTISSPAGLRSLSETRVGRKRCTQHRSATGRTCWWAQNRGCTNLWPNMGICLVVEPTPLKNDGVRQLGLWHSQSMEKWYNIPNHQPTRYGNVLDKHLMPLKTTARVFFHCLIHGPCLVHDNMYHGSAHRDS